jgi:hypothetical protein
VNKARKSGWLITAFLSVTLVWTSCSTAWITEAEQIVAALIPATANLVALVATVRGMGLSASDLQTIQSTSSQVQADLQLIQSLIAEYQKADAAAQPGLLSQIQTETSVVESSLNELLPALHVKDAATQSKVTAVVGLLLSEMESMVAVLPALKSGSPATARSSGLPKTKRSPLTASEFVSSYNATMTAKTGNKTLDRAATGLQIHLHSRLERWISAGLLK